MTDPGVKNDLKKVRWDLIPSDALEEVAKVLSYGAHKYAERNWERGISWHRCFRAIMNHAWYWWRGQTKDPETGYSHMAHVACNALFLTAYELRDMKIYDDRERLYVRDERALQRETRELHLLAALATANNAMTQESQGLTRSQMRELEKYLKEAEL